MQATTQTLTRQEDLLRLYMALLKQDQVRAISLTEPWGTLIATEAKRNETRSWPARLSPNGPLHRGPLAIHCSKRMDDAICYEEPFAEALLAAGYQPHHKNWGLPLGCIIAVAWLKDIWQISPRTAHRIPDSQSAEYAFGDYQPGRFIWSFSCAYRLKTPIPAKGALGLWHWTPNETFWSEIQAQADQLRLPISKERKGPDHG